MKAVFLFLAILLINFNANAKTSFSAVIPVETEAEDSVVAKDKAMLEAQRQGFLEVAKQLTAEDNTAKLNELSDDEILHFIKSVGVANEKSGGNKYKADLTVEINGTLLKDYLIENEMIKTETTNLAVIPVYKDLNAEPVLWERENVWKQSWQSKGLIKFGAMQLKTISEIAKSDTNMDAEKAIYMNSDLYNQLQKICGTSQIYVVYAEKLINGDLKVTLKNEKNKNEDNFTILASEIDNPNELFDKAIEKTVMYISNMERNAEATDDKPANGKISAVYSYTNMKDWLEKSQNITNLQNVENVETNSFGGGKVNFTISYTGSLDNLWNALQEIGMSHESVDNYFIIR